MSSSYRVLNMRHASVGRRCWRSVSSSGLPQEINFVPFGSASAEWDSACWPVSRALQATVVWLVDMISRRPTRTLRHRSYTDIPQIGYNWTSGSAEQYVTGT